MYVNSEHVYLCTDYHLHHDTAKQGYSGVVRVSTGEWNGALLSSVMRVVFVCMRVMNVHVYGEDLMSFMFLSSFAHDTQGPTSGVMVWVLSVTTR